MKKFLFLSLLAVWILSGCTDKKQHIYFEEPQPKNEKDQQRFKNRFLGTWLNLADSSILYVSHNMLVTEKSINFVVLKKELDSMPDFKIKNDSIFGGDFGNGTKIRSSHDSIFTTFVIKDTIFNISNDQLLRFFKGNYFLNHRVGEKQWMVEKMSLNGRNNLNISELLLSEKDSLKNFTEVKEVPKSSDSTIVDYYIKPSRKELKNYVRDGGFREKNEYIRIKIKRK